MKDVKKVWGELIAKITENKAVMNEDTAERLITLLSRARRMGIEIDETGDGKYIVRGDDIRRLGHWDKATVLEYLREAQYDPEFAINVSAWFTADGACGCVDPWTNKYTYDDDTYHNIRRATLAMSIQAMARTSKYYTGELRKYHIDIKRECEVHIAKIGLILIDTVGWGSDGARRGTAHITV